MVVSSGVQRKPQAPCVNERVSAGNTRADTNRNHRYPLMVADTRDRAWYVHLSVYDMIPQNYEKHGNCNTLKGANLRKEHGLIKHAVTSLGGDTWVYRTRTPTHVFLACEGQT